MNKRQQYTKRMTANAWFRLQMRPDLEVIEVHSEIVDGEKLMVATFTIEETR